MTETEQDYWQEEYTNRELDAEADKGELTFLAQGINIWKG
jgi:hypothetical protein